MPTLPRSRRRTKRSARARSRATRSRSETRVRELASKSYWAQFERSPEFAVLFLPGDQFLSAALAERPELLENALAQSVIIATPSTLVALLKAVAYGWRQSAVAQNAAQIRDLGQELYRRLGTFNAHLGRMGQRLSGAVEAYNAAVGSLERQVMPQARRFHRARCHRGRAGPPRSSRSASWCAAPARRAPRKPRPRPLPCRGSRHRPRQPCPPRLSPPCRARSPGCTPRRSAAVLEALLGVEEEIRVALKAGLEHDVAHARLAWWREECTRLRARYPRASPDARARRAFRGRPARGARRLRRPRRARRAGILRGPPSAHGAELTGYCERWSAALIVPLARAALPQAPARRPRLRCRTQGARAAPQLARDAPPRQAAAAAR